MYRRLILVVALAVAGWMVGVAFRDKPAPAPSATTSPGPSVAFSPPTAAPTLGIPSADPEVAESPPSTLHPRPAGEWDGMLVDMSQRQYCEASSYCGFALACLDDAACGPCQRDDQCANGEVCVLDHCVLTANAGCRTRSDCTEDSLCVLTGLTGGEPRGNSTMRSMCQSSRGGTQMADDAPDERRAEQLAAAAAQTPIAPPIGADDLRARLDQELTAH